MKMPTFSDADAKAASALEEKELRFKSIVDKAENNPHWRPYKGRLCQEEVSTTHLPSLGNEGSRLVLGRQLYRVGEKLRSDRPEVRLAR